MLEREVNNSVRSSGSALKAVEVVKVTVMYLGTCFFQRRGTIVCSGKSDDLMAGVDEFPNDGRADVSRCSCYKNTHHDILLKPLSVLRLEQLQSKL